MQPFGIKLARGQSHPSPLEYTLWLGGLALSVLVTAVLTRLALQLLAEAEVSAKSTAPLEVA